MTVGSGNTIHGKEKWRKEHDNVIECLETLASVEREKDMGGQMKERGSHPMESAQVLVKLVQEQSEALKELRQRIAVVSQPPEPESGAKNEVADKAARSQLMMALEEIERRIRLNIDQTANIIQRLDL